MNKIKKMEFFKFKPIGVIKTPFTKIPPPYQPPESGSGNFKVILFPEYKDGLFLLDRFKYIYLIYFLNKSRDFTLSVKPPWTDKKVGLFSSRSPRRINPIGLSVVKIKKIAENIIYTSPIDVYDETPLLDIKPYIKDLDSKEDANYGWLEETKDLDHLLLHIKGIPH